MNRRREWERSTYRPRMIKFFYQITLDQFNEQERKQNFACAVCLRIPLNGKVLQVDHVHGQHAHVGTKRGCAECIRGLVCNNCNRSIIPILEKSEHLQTDFIKAYLLGRPFMDRRC